MLDCFRSKIMVSVTLTQFVFKNLVFAPVIDNLVG